VLKPAIEKTIKIGLFDSGIGGLTVLRRLKTLFSGFDCNVQFTYVADTQRCPYGNRNANEISQYVTEITSFLLTKSVDCIVMACNTSAALATEKATKLASPIRVQDLIEPTAKYASKYQNIGVFATASTVASKAFSKAINCFNDKANIHEIACPNLVPAIEGGQVNAPHTAQLVEDYVRQLTSQHIEAVILGCTHFPILENLFRQYLPVHIEIIDPACLLPKQLSILCTDLVKSGKHTNVVTTNYYVTGDTDKFIQTANAALIGETNIFKSSENVSSLSLNDLAVYAKSAYQESVGLSADASIGSLQIEGSPA
jgi:glutamate racemase